MDFIDKLINSMQGVRKQYPLQCHGWQMLRIIKTVRNWSLPWIPRNGLYECPYCHHEFETIHNNVTQWRYCPLCGSPLKPTK